MNRRLKPEPSEKIPCDIIAGMDKTSHSPISPTAPEDKIMRI